MRAGTGAVLAALITAGGLLVGAGAAAGSDGPTIGLARGVAIERGFSAFLQGTGLVPAASYTLSTDGGAFTDSGDTQVTLLANGNGTVAATLKQTARIAADRSAVHVSLTSSDDALVAEADVPVAPPVLERISLCPARSFSFGGPYFARGFADGDYVLSGAHLTFAPSTVQASGGSFEPVVVSADASLPATFQVTATVEGTGFVAAASTLPRQQPRSQRDDSGANPWRLRFDLDCFAPGETVTVNPVDPRATAVNPTPSADGDGVAHVALRLHPRSSTSGWAGAIVVGGSSGQHGNATAAATGVYGTTLLGGQFLQRPVRWDEFPTHLMLASAQYGYTFNAGCNPSIAWWPGSGGSRVVWSARPGHPTESGTCQLTLQRNGDLVLRSTTGNVLWRTRTAGTGAGNRLVIQSNGNLALRTATGTLLWSRETGRIPDPSTATLLAGHSLATGQSLTRGAWKLTLDRHGRLRLLQAGQVRWSTRTYGSDATRLVLSPSGNLALLRPDGHIVWSTHSGDAGPAARLVLQEIGNLTLYDRHYALLWQTHTGG